MEIDSIERYFIQAYFKATLAANRGVETWGVACNLGGPRSPSPNTLLTFQNASLAIPVRHRISDSHFLSSVRILFRCLNFCTYIFWGVSPICNWNFGIIPLLISMHSVFLQLVIITFSSLSFIIYCRGFFTYR